MKLTVQFSAEKIVSIDVPADATVEDVKKAAQPKVCVHRQSYKFKAGGSNPVTLASGKKLSEYGIKDGSTLLYKDLGPQIGYRTVFLVEYAGPIGIMLFYASQPSFIYGAKPAALGETQKLFINIFIAHFAKRELESLFVHKFSHATMPLRNIFKNSIYYWSFAAVIGYHLCKPSFKGPEEVGLDKKAAIAMGLFELGNFLVHLQFSLMRKSDGDAKREAPGGPLFSLVSCPNYTFETLSWAAFSVGTGLKSSWTFTFFGFLQMADWAVKKHLRYIKDEPSVAKKCAIVPFFL